MLNTFFSHLSDLVKTFWPFPGSVFVLMVRVHIQRVELPGPVIELARGDDGDVEGGPGVQLHCLHTVRVVGLAGHGYHIILLYCTILYDNAFVTSETGKMSLGFCSSLFW